MVKTVTTISRELARPHSGAPIVLVEPSIEKVVALQEQSPGSCIIATFRNNLTPEQIKKLFGAGVGQINVCLGE